MSPFSQEEMDKTGGILSLEPEGSALDQLRPGEVKPEEEVEAKAQDEGDELEKWPQAQFWDSASGVCLPTDAA